eukprot:m.62272 g.62272  ORF g.62272 m.62272 type:complete len:247 (+) comp11904_c0_seq1:1911-2651(+)
MLKADLDRVLSAFGADLDPQTASLLYRILGIEVPSDRDVNVKGKVRAVQSVERDSVPKAAAATSSAIQASPTPTSGSPQQSQTAARQTAHNKQQSARTQVAVRPPAPKAAKSPDVSSSKPAITAVASRAAKRSTVTSVASASLNPTPFSLPQKLSTFVNLPLDIECGSRVPTEPDQLAAMQLLQQLSLLELKAPLLTKGLTVSGLFISHSMSQLYSFDFHSREWSPDEAVTVSKYIYRRLLLLLPF